MTVTKGLDASPQFRDPRALGGEARPAVHGKFLFVGEEKLYVRGVTYGTFAPSRGGEHYPDPDVVASDFAQMEANGFNAVRTYTVPPGWLLDQAADCGLRVMVGIPWEQHVDFLEDRRRARSRLRSGRRRSSAR